MGGRQFSTIREDILERWRKAVEIEGVPKEAFKPEIKIVGDESERSRYNFGVILNEHRYKRHGIIDSKKENGACNLCKAVNSIEIEQERNLFPNYELLDFIVVPNKFPIVEGISLAITKKERPMYTTKDLSGVLEELEIFLNFTDKTGFEVFHNSPGFGATIPGHEHWHLTTFRTGYCLVGKKYGFDAAEKACTMRSTRVKIMPDFPFAHLIFDKQDTERIVSFLSKADKEIGDRYNGKGVPHTISQGYDGLLITIGKEYLERCRGSGDVAGHLVVKSQEEFYKMKYMDCMAELDKVLFRKEDINLERFI